MRWCAPFLAVVALSGCATTPPPPAPFPLVDARTDEEVLSVLRARTSAARTLYALLEIEYDSPEIHGTFKAACRYEAPGKIRIQAFKDIIIMAPEPIFDLCLLPDSYAIDVAATGERPALRDRGPPSKLATAHPRFAPFARLGEGLFLPGILREGAPATVRRSRRPSDPFEVLGVLPSGAGVVLRLDHATLAPREATFFDLPGSGGRPDALEGAGFVEYGDWRVERGVFLPGRVVCESGGTRSVTRVLEVEVNAPLEADAFRVD